MTFATAAGTVRLMSFGLTDRGPKPLVDADGAFKCVICYDRQKSGLTLARGTSLSDGIDRSGGSMVCADAP